MVRYKLIKTNIETGEGPITNSQRVLCPSITEFTPPFYS